MEKIATLGILYNYLSWGDQNILGPIEYVVDIELITYNKMSHSIVKKTKSRKIIDPKITILYKLRIN
jgi:hypothetical protein